MGPVEVIIVDEKKLRCDGEKGSSKHPLIYLNMGEKNYITCPYCNRYFKLRTDDKATFESKISN
ncbi:MAG: putative Zn-finger protein [Rickettsiales bacterium]|jgi:uncharacterized Zn-finger protein